ncbi:hypothetical protein H4R34_002755 [Dimargaris verticillata]|uniref:RING-CH-type domain-containing protein n=1 Tax=Dimargaris verticillata TaxID=2761393 RepID=A0A9W8B5X4_9FUNG|nr:hypothetical protein H4R34_002755 [Dimargaris verticillata]
MTLSTARSLAEPRRCWICLGDDSDSSGAWVQPCPCSLVCHQYCLLNWITERQRDDPDAECQARYRLVEYKSLLYKLLRHVDAAINKLVTTAVVLGLSSCALICLTTYGAYAVLTFYGTREGERLLGAPNPWGWRTWLGLPTVPLILIASRMSTFDIILPIIPLLISKQEGLYFSNPPTPSLTITLLPWVRVAYNELYYHFFSELEVNWYKYVSSDAEAVETVTAVTSAQGRQLRERAGAAPDHAAFSAGRDSQQLVQPDGAIDDHNPINDGGHDDLAITYETDIFLQNGAIVRSVVGALLFPAISSFCGGLLGQVPLVRARLPTRFHQNIVGGCLFVLLKDITTVFYKYLALKVRWSRTIQEYRRPQD